MEDARGPDGPSTSARRELGANKEVRGLAPTSESALVSKRLKGESGGVERLCEMGMDCLLISERGANGVAQGCVMGTERLLRSAAGEN